MIDVDEAVARLAIQPAPRRALPPGCGALHGFPGFGRGAPEITVPWGALATGRPGHVHRATDLGGGEATLVGGIPVTTKVGTLLDLSSVVPPARLGAALDDLVAAL